jgi:thioredoxin 1
MSSVKEVSDVTFDTEVLQSDMPVLIDFYATWCGPCKIMAPVIDEIARDYAGRMKVVKIDVDEAQETVTHFGVTAMPTFIVLRNGQETFRRLGAAPKAAFVKDLERVL